VRRRSRCAARREDGDEGAVHRDQEGIVMRRRLPELPVELLLAAAILVVVGGGTVIEVRYAPYPVPAPVGAYVLAALSCLILVLRRRFPLAVTIAGIALLAAYHLAGYPGGAPALSLFVSFYSLSLYWPSRWTFVAAAVLIVADVLVFSLPRHPTPWYSFAVLGPAIGLAWMVVLGGAAGFRRRATEERVRQAAVTAEARLRERLADERLRIARELHDVLAHTISVIAVQSGAALDSLDAEPERARTALRVVRTAAKQAMPELRAALGLLRSDGYPAPDRFSQPTLDQLDELVEHARAAGLRVTVTADPLELPVFLGLTAYRIVQEALTNVVRHAGASSVHVAIARSSDGVTIDVSDDGNGSAPAGSGLGLAGMRERVALVGGAVTAGPGPSGGWTVHADLPVEASP
jgi:signal transduction histidine kinase